MGNWKEDPRLKDLDKKKLDMLEEFSEKVKRAPKNRLLPALLSLNMEAQAKGIVFSDQETEAIVSILSAGMTPQEQKKIDMLKMFSRRLSGRKKKLNSILAAALRTYGAKGPALASAFACQEPVLLLHFFYISFS